MLVLHVLLLFITDCTDRHQMLTLLSELKILIHIGQHLNILNLLGAVTKNMARGNIYQVEKLVYPFYLLVILVTFVLLIYQNLHFTDTHKQGTYSIFIRKIMSKFLYLLD